jgi:hypothetical protein
MGLILLIVLVILLFGSAPAYGYSRTWGYRPMGLLSILLLVVLLLVIFDILSLGFGLHHPWQQPIVVPRYRIP